MLHDSDAHLAHADHAYVSVASERFLKEQLRDHLLHLKDHLREALGAADSSGATLSSPLSLRPKAARSPPPPRSVSPARRGGTDAAVPAWRFGGVAQVLVLGLSRVI